MLTPPPVSPENLQPLRRIVEQLERWHSHSVIGLENIPKEGRALLVINHSLATYDAFLLGARILFDVGRPMYGLADTLIFKIPGLREFASSVGLVEAGPRVAQDLLAQGHLVGVAPGGMREALRPSKWRYQLRWQTRTGFVRLALETRAPIILAACPSADDIYTVHPNQLTRYLYKTFKIPVPMATGWGGTFLPKPVKLTHHIDSPLLPPPIAGEKATEEEIRLFHSQVVARMEALMVRALAAEGSPLPPRQLPRKM